MTNKDATCIHANDLTLNHKRRSDKFIETPMPKKGSLTPPTKYVYPDNVFVVFNNGHFFAIYRNEGRAKSIVWEINAQRKWWRDWHDALIQRNTKAYYKKCQVR